MPTENLWIISHLLIACIGILLLQTFPKVKLSEVYRSAYYYWLAIAVQFAFGGLLSTFLVFYFRSATLSASWPFLLILFIAFVFNEVFKQHYARLTFQVSYLFLSTFSFAIYYVPILFSKLGSDVFIISGLVSLLAVFIFLLILTYFNNEEFVKSRKSLRYSIFGIYIIFNFLYFTNVIPPIPLSLKDAGVFHSVKRNSDGNYNVQYEDNGWTGFFRNEIFHAKIGDPVYVYTAVFSPTNLNTKIVHIWQYYDEVMRAWIVKDKVELAVNGGREGGFRTYSIRSFSLAGKWQVDVETLTGQVIGKVKFTAERVEKEPVLIKDVKL
ncbi:MAG: DUF2914 domain-containing protein [bacterium]